MSSKLVALLGAAAIPVGVWWGGLTSALVANNFVTDDECCTGQNPFYFPEGPADRAAGGETPAACLPLGGWRN
jgi:hypothetical protein